MPPATECQRDATPPMARLPPRHLETVLRVRTVPRVQRAPGAVGPKQVRLAVRVVRRQSQSARGPSGRVGFCMSGHLSVTLTSPRLALAKAQCQLRVTPLPDSLQSVRRALKHSNAHLANRTL